MPTETIVRVARARYGGFVATFNWNGQWNRVFFENAIEVAAELADECVDPATIESVLDAFETMEWSDSDYPLFRPAEAVCDYDEPIYPPGTLGYEMQRYQRPSPFWDWFAVTLHIGAVTAPWVILLILGRVAWAKAVAWGWV